MCSSSRALAASIAAVAVTIGCAVAGKPATAQTNFHHMEGVENPATPDHLDRVGVLKVGPRKASNILVLIPGTSASAAYFHPLARHIVRRTRGWRVWAVERRENQLEDHSMLDRAKAGDATPRELFDYYLGWIADPSIAERVETPSDAEVGFAREWGMGVAVRDLRRVIRAARKRARTRARVERRKRPGRARQAGRVVLGGHSLGGSITTAYATWDFRGNPGARGLSGLVYIDGGGHPAARLDAAEAREQLREIESGSPWLAFGGIPSPLMGLFSLTASSLAIMDPHGPSMIQGFPALPGDLRAPLPLTQRAAWAYGVDSNTSPPSLAAAQFSLGRLADEGEPRDWVRAGAITPLRRSARIASGWNLQGLDGTAWYHPRRLTLDAGAVAGGNANPAQEVLGLRAIHGDRLGRMPIYAFAASLGGSRVLEGARALARQSGVPPRRVRLVDRSSTYAHNDPSSAYPRNAFVKDLVRFLRTTQAPAVAASGSRGQHRELGPGLG
jgi:hypothetical protein